VSFACSGLDCDGDGSTHVHDHVGVQVATGVSDRLELRARYEHAMFSFDEGTDTGSFNVVGFGPKVRLVKDRVAFYAPVGFAFGNEMKSGDTFSIHPTLLLTQPLHRNVEANGSAKLLIPLTAENGETLAAFNLGLGIGHLDRWAIRPEVGILVNPGEEGHFTQLSIGVSFRPGK
jgi:hypothetical protein